MTSPADELVDMMYDDIGDDARRALAIMAIKVDMGCIEAHLVLAEQETEYPSRQLAHLQIAVQTGRQLWAPVAREYGRDMKWWSFTGTRPYMRAIAALGEFFMDHRQDASARACFARLLKMDPADYLGVGRFMEMVPPRPRGRAGP